ncbi:hypothetical protein C8R45DRAFT_984878 [Mycena sanguinolenta]|nr:hypothetical protein C8R45DRAFT_984878 [Mycena sanguinolenta]
MSEPICPPSTDGTFTEEDDSCNLSLVICSSVSSLSSSKCECSVIAYLINAACSACSSLDTSWEGYASDNNCAGLPQQFPSPLPSAFSAPAGTFPLPSWALAMASATPTPTTFNFAAAQSFAVAASEQVFQSDSTSTFSSTTKTSSSTTKTSSSISSKSMSDININISTSTSPSSTPMPAGGSSRISSQKKTPPAGTIVGIIILICALITFAILSLVCLRRRRRRRLHHAEVLTTPLENRISVFDTVTSTTGTYPPSKSSDQPSLVRVRRQFLQNELWATQEKMVDIQQAPHTRLLAVGGDSNDAGTDSDAMSELRQRNEVLAARIRELEGHMNSPWALGLSDEPPPGYSEEEQ